MYWANRGRKPTIERADLDGSNRHTVIANVRSPTSLTIDYSLGLLFWVDIKNQVIECANLDGTNRRIFLSGLSKPFALTQYKDYIYWTDNKLNSIYRANKANGLDQTKIISDIDDIMDILVFHGSRQEGLCMIIVLILLCMYVCMYVCSVGVHGHAQCPCPMDMILAENNSSCRG